jgi:2-amino-4-hydroxy-6-hydroxymethyldihydropteridine diphosphokinase
MVCFHHERTLSNVDAACNAHYRWAMILIALGANLPHPKLGPAPAVFDAAVEELQACGLVLVKRSNIYENAAVGPGEQPDYSNAAVAMTGSDDAPYLLQLLLDIEQRLGRERQERWGPRIIDLDLIAVGAQVVPEQGTWEDLSKDSDADPKQSLILPHPRAHKRSFVLKPLMDIAPDWQHPVLNKSVGGLLSQLNDDHPLFQRPWE